MAIDAVRAAGPSGPHGDKRAAAVRPGCDIAASSLAAHCKERLLALRARRVTRAGVGVIKARGLPTRAANTCVPRRRYPGGANACARRPRRRGPPRRAVQRPKASQVSRSRSRNRAAQAASMGIAAKNSRWSNGARYCCQLETTEMP